MRRGDLYRVTRPHGGDPKRFRVFVVVSRQASIDSRFSSVICTARHGLATQVDVGPGEGLRHDSSIHCDELLSLHKSRLTHFVGSLGAERIERLDHALTVALDIGRGWAAGSRSLH